MLIKCPECGRQVSDKASNCPECGCPINVEKKVEKPKSDGVHYARPNGALPKREEQPKKKKTWIWVVVGIIAIFVLIGSSGGDEETKNTSENVVKENIEVEETEPIQVEYIKYDVDEMVNVLSENALKAEKTFQDQYVEVTGILRNIDSDGKYISLDPINEEFSLYGVQCYIQNEEQINQVLEMKIDDTITVKGKITSVGEVMGYSLDIDSIE